MSLTYKLEFLSKYASVDSAVVHAFLRLRLFQHIPTTGQEGIPISELAKRVGADPRGTQILVEVLAATDVLVLDLDNNVSLNPTLVQIFNDSGSVQKLLEPIRWWEPVGKLTEAVQTGKPVNYQGTTWDILAYYVGLFENETSSQENVVDEYTRLFDRSARQYLRAQVLICTAEMDLLSHFLQGEYSSKQCAETLQVSQEGISVLLRMLVQLGVLEENDGRYHYHPEIQPLLTQRSITMYNQGWQLAGLFWSALGSLDETLLHSQRILDLQDPEQSNAFYRALAKYNTVIFPSYFRLTRSVGTIITQSRTCEGVSILDVGAGSGVWGIGLASTIDTAQITFLDQANVLPQTRLNAEKLGLAKRSHFWTGDLSKADFGKERFDIIVLGQICHTQNPQDLPDLFQRLSRALRPDGLLIVADLFLHDHRDGPLHFLYFAVKEYVSTQGSLLTWPEYHSLLANEGLVTLGLYHQTGLDIAIAGHKTNALTLATEMPTSPSALFL